jgi:hypothetical protein
MWHRSCNLSSLLLVLLLLCCHLQGRLGAALRYLEMVPGEASTSVAVLKDRIYRCGMMVHHSAYVGSVLGAVAGGAFRGCVRCAQGQDLQLRRTVH